MKNEFTKKNIFLGFILCLGFSQIHAQYVTPTTIGAKIFCDGTSVSYTDATSTIPATHDPKIYHSLTKVNIPTDDPATTGTDVTPTTGTTIATPQTGYYYIKGVPNSSNSGLCETPYQEIPIYIFKPLTIVSTPANYCNTNTPVVQNSTPDSTDPYTTLAFQWYKAGATPADDVKINSASASTQNYTPVATDGLVVGINKLRVRVGYSVPGLGIYCVALADHDLTLNPTPSAPNVTVTGATPITF